MMGGLVLGLGSFDQVLKIFISLANKELCYVPVMQ